MGFLHGLLQRVPKAPTPAVPAPPAKQAGPVQNNVVPLRKAAKSPQEAHDALRTRLRRMAAEDVGGWNASGLASHFASANPDEGEEHE